MATLSWPATLPQSPAWDYRGTPTVGLNSAEETRSPRRTRTRFIQEMTFVFPAVTLAQRRALDDFWEATNDGCLPWAAPWLGDIRLAGHVCRFASPPKAAALGAGWYRVEIVCTVLPGAGTINANRTYADRVLALRPYAYYPLDDAGGIRARDRSPHVRHGRYDMHVTPGGGAVLSPSGLPSSQFTRGRVVLPFNTYFDRLGIAFWSQGGGTISDAHVISCGEFSSYVFGEGETNAAFRITRGPTSLFVTAINPATGSPTEFWYTVSSADLVHVAVNYIGASQLTLYINGALADARTLDFGVRHTQLPWTIGMAARETGKDYVGRTHYIGALSDVVLRAEPFAAQEVAMLAGVA